MTSDLSVAELSRVSSIWELLSRHFTDIFNMTEHARDRTNSVLAKKC